MASADDDENEAKYPEKVRRKFQLLQKKKRKRFSETPENI